MNTPSPNPPRIILVSSFADLSGGEAIRALQFFERLAAVRDDVWLITHERSRRDMDGRPFAHRVRYVADGRVQNWLWRLKLSKFNQPIFHWLTRALIRDLAPPGQGHIVHYVCPISPVAPRFPPQGYRLIIGPLNGNIAYPDCFAAREGRGARLRHKLHFLMQRLLRLTGEKRRYETVLVSGYERTHVSLKAAGVDPARMVDVADVGVPEAWRDAPRQTHAGRHTGFVTASRLTDLKGIDLAIRAVAQAGPDITLDVFGEGEARAGWEALARDLGLEDRVQFRGWCAHDDLLARFAEYRGFVFPTLAEANGNVMQEAMLAGLPVIALNWGGPSRLADATSAIYVEPDSEAQIIADFAAGMDRLAEDAAFAEQISINARTLAEARFPWDRVIETWTAPYRTGD